MNKIELQVRNSRRLHVLEEDGATTLGSQNAEALGAGVQKLAGDGPRWSCSRLPLQFFIQQPYGELPLAIKINLSSEEDEVTI